MTLTQFSGREVAALLGLPESRIRYWAQTGLIGPSQRANGRALYDFADLIALKSAQAMLAAGLSLQSARRLVAALKEQLPGRALGELRVVADGDRVVCSGAGTPFEPLSGQLVLDFSTAELAAQMVALAAKTPAHADEPAPCESAYDRFVEAIRLESIGDDGSAEAAYGEALTLDPQFAAAHNNLGLLHHRRGKLDQAVRAFSAALALDPDQPEARYNLGCIREELGAVDEARQQWTRAIVLAPALADAHFNLGASLIEAGQVDLGRLHLHHYLALVADGPWADRARELCAPTPVLHAVQK